VNTATLVLDAAPEIVVTPVTDRKSWDALFAFAPTPHFTQAWCHGEGKRAEGWQVERLLFSDTDGMAALCQLLVKRPLGARVTRIECGPVFLRDEAAPELQLAVLRALRRRWRFGLRGLLLMAPSLPYGEASSVLMRDAGFWSRGDAGWRSSYLDLQLPLDELRRRLAPDRRADIRRAQKLGVGLRLRRDRAGIEWLLEKHAENLRAGTLTGPSSGYIRSAFASSPDDFWLLQAMVDGEPAAGLLVGRFGQHAQNLIAWFNDPSRRAPVENFLVWNAVIEMQRNGCRTLDLGGSPTQERTAHGERATHGIGYQLAGEWLAF
jgi:hypothetical protein